MLPGSHLYPLRLSPRQTAKGPMEMPPVPLVSLCPRSLWLWLHQPKAGRKVQDGEKQFRSNLRHKKDQSWRTYSWATSSSKGQFSVVCYTVTQRVLSGAESYAGVLVLYWLSLFLPFLPWLPQCTSWNPLPDNLLTPKVLSEGLHLREPKVKQRLASESQCFGHMSASREKWSSLEKVVEGEKWFIPNQDSRLEIK